MTQRLEYRSVVAAIAAGALAALASSGCSLMQFESPCDCDGGFVTDAAASDNAGADRSPDASGVDRSVDAGGRDRPIDAATADGTRDAASADSSADAASVDSGTDGAVADAAVDAASQLSINCPAGQRCTYLEYTATDHQCTLLFDGNYDCQPTSAIGSAYSAFECKMLCTGGNSSCGEQHGRVDALVAACLACIDDCQSGTVMICVNEVVGGCQVGGQTLACDCL